MQKRKEQRQAEAEAEAEIEAEIEAEAKAVLPKPETRTFVAECLTQIIDLIVAKHVIAAERDDALARLDNARQELKPYTRLKRAYISAMSIQNMEHGLHDWDLKLLADLGIENCQVELERRHLEEA